MDNQRSKQLEKCLLNVGNFTNSKSQSFDSNGSNLQLETFLGFKFN